MSDLTPSQVALADPFWSPRVEVNASRAIFHQWEQLEASGCIDNFRIAAGELAGLREGWFFRPFGFPCVHDGHLSKSILDAGWGYFAQHLTHKAAWAGRVVVQVNPAHTSRTCSQCGSRFAHLALADRWVQCDCGLSLDRDENAARNLLARGQRAWGATWPVAASVPQEAAGL